MSRIGASPYLEWAKLQSAATWNLAASGVVHATLADLGGMPEAIPLAGPNAYGYGPLLEHVAAHHGVDASQVATATGCSMANFLALAALVEPGDEVLIERPTYEPLRLAAAHLGASITRFDRQPADGFRLDAEAVIAVLTPRTRAVVLANPHNPSSHLAPLETLRRIGDAAVRVGARVLVVETYLDAVFASPPGSCVHLGPAFVSTGSLTKVYGLSALRCGWVVGEAALVHRIWRLNDLYGNVQPFVMDCLAVAAFERLPALRARAQGLLETNHAIFADWARGRDDLAFAMPAWGTTVCARPLHVEAERLCADLRARYDVSVVPGHFFEAPDHVRVGLCGETSALREGLSRLGACLTALRDAPGAGPRHG